MRGLKYNQDERYQKFYTYLELVKQWRNNESHTAPDASLQELSSAVHVVSTMYLWIILHHVEELNRVINE